MKKYLIFLGVVLMLSGAVPLLASGRVWSEVADDIAYVHHDDAYFNCCPEMVFEISQDGYTIDIFEQDTLPQCLCMCYYNFTHALKDLSPGTYTARVWESGSPNDDYSLAGTTEFTIQAMVEGSKIYTQMSDCHMEPEGTSEEPRPSRGVELENISAKPIQGSVGIRYYLPETSGVIIEIYDVTGVKIRTLQAGYQEAGDHVITWDVRDRHAQPVPAGIYFVRLRTGTQARSLPLVVVR